MSRRSPTLSQPSAALVLSEQQRPAHYRSHSLWSIAVKMATGSGWQQYYCPASQGKFSSSTASSVSFQSGITMEYTQDLHLKMSKKIAQLTKVRVVTGPMPLSLNVVSSLTWVVPLPPILCVWEQQSPLGIEPTYRDICDFWIFSCRHKWQLSLCIPKIFFTRKTFTKVGYLFTLIKMVELLQ